MNDDTLDAFFVCCQRRSSPNTDFECSSFNPPISVNDLCLHHICATEEQCYFALSFVRNLDVYDSGVHDILLEVKSRTDSTTIKAHIENILLMWPVD